MPRIPGEHNGWGFRGIRQRLPCKSIATAGGFPVRNGRNECRDSCAPNGTLNFRFGNIHGDPFNILPDACCP